MKHIKIRSIAIRGAAMAWPLLLLTLAACATEGGQEAVYRGVQRSAETCKARQQPGAAPCANLPGYADYEVERKRARGVASPSLAQERVR